ncbi:MAG: polyprenyl synthetase family protein [Oscillospiraceae bacterium]|jgi:geranylgeranyl diphosphate synthase type II|nr:polyprenyl synthetase family protein [Oscillospiraceae bacterium]
MTYEGYVQAVEAALDQAIPLPPTVYEDGHIPEPLARAMRYSLLTGGKRLRPVLLLAAVDMLGGDGVEAMPLACALEMIHTYSLIHDDLPAMDDDDTRRGCATSHRAFGEAMAILAGDGLLNAAHELMLQNALRYPAHLARHVAAIAEISRRAGVTGMVAGQCMDVSSQGRGGDAALLRYIHLHKTADLLTAPLAAGALLCGAPGYQVDALSAFGQRLGLAFQISDDLLDVEGDPAAMGKAVGADARLRKLTWPGLHGVPAARAQAEALLNQALDILAPFGAPAAFLQNLAVSLASRRA